MLEAAALQHETSCELVIDVNRYLVRLLENCVVEFGFCLKALFGYTMSTYTSALMDTISATHVTHLLLTMEPSRVLICLDLVRITKHNPCMVFNLSQQARTNDI